MFADIAQIDVIFWLVVITFQLWAFWHFFFISIPREVLKRKPTAFSKLTSMGSMVRKLEDDKSEFEALLREWGEDEVANQVRAVALPSIIEKHLKEYRKLSSKPWKYYNGRSLFTLRRLDMLEWESERLEIELLFSRHVLRVMREKVGHTTI